jgi:hypothetical protein
LRLGSVGLLLSILALASASARAQTILPSPPPATLGIGTSIRSAAMAGAGAAVLWGEPDVWANPATLAGLRGVSWVQGHTNLNPSFSNDVVFDSQQLLIGGAGVGVSMMGQPFTGLGRARFDTGPIVISAPFPPEPFEVIETTESFGLGISPLRVLDALRTDREPGHARLTDVGELAFGYQTERTHLHIEPTFDGSLEVGESDDWGVSGSARSRPSALASGVAATRCGRRVLGSQPGEGVRRVYGVIGLDLRYAPARPPTGVGGSMGRKLLVTILFLAAWATPGTAQRRCVVEALDALGAGSRRRR